MGSCAFVCVCVFTGVADNAENRLCNVLVVIIIIQVSTGNERFLEMRDRPIFQIKDHNVFTDLLILEIRQNIINLYFEINLLANLNVFDFRILDMENG